MARELERQRHEESARRAEVRQLQETRRAEQQEVVRMMLPLSHNYAIKHYATILTRAQNVAAEVSNYQQQRRSGSAPAELAAALATALDAVTYETVALYAANRKLIVRVGAYYFKNRAGEALVVAAFNQFSMVLFPRGDAAGKAISPVIDVVERHNSLPQATFETMVAADSNATAKLTVVRQGLEAWMQSENCDAGVGYLRIFAAVPGI
jgi:hypothetical protein